MDIQQALSLLAEISAENHKNFKKQTNHFKIELTDPLKDYLDTIDSDVTKWLKTTPDSYKKKSTFYAFKSPVCTLLKHKDVIAQFGETYCTLLSEKIKQVFSDNIDNIINERTKKNCIEIQDTQTTDNDTSTDDNDSENSDDTQSIKSNHSSFPENIEYRNPKDRKKTIDDYNKRINDLETKNQEAQTTIKLLQTELVCIKNERDNYLKLLMK